MLQAGVHFGHKKFRRNPKMDPYIHTTRGGMSIIDLGKTATALQDAFDYVVDLTARGGNILFVGTKKQASAMVELIAKETGIPFINTRWLGGTFTNFETMSSRIKKLRKLEEQKEKGELGKYTKRERLQIERDMEKMRRDFGGIANLDKLPQAIFVVDVKREHLAIREAARKGMKIIAMVDTNCSPEGIDYVIPANDDAVKAIELIARTIAEAVKEGRSRQMKAVTTPASKPEAKAVEAKEAEAVKTESK